MSKKKESTATNAAEPADNDMFSDVAEIGDKFKRRNLPVLVMHKDVPIGKAISGEIIDAIASPSTSVKGNLLWIKQDSGRELTFPVIGSVRTALVGMKKDDEVLPALKKEIGKKIVCRRLASATGKRGLLFEVFTAD